MFSRKQCKQTPKIVCSPGVARLSPFAVLFARLQTLQTLFDRIARTSPNVRPTSKNVKTRHSPVSRLQTKNGRTWDIEKNQDIGKKVIKSV